MGCYDTVNMWLPIDQAGKFDYLKCAQNLSQVIEHYKETGDIYSTGYLKNYKVAFSEQGISLKGSISKYFLPDNFHCLTRSDIAPALEKMSDELHLPIEKATIRRFDFADNIMLKYSPEAYLKRLGDSPHYTRQFWGKTLYYRNGLRQKVFYDKVAEGKKKGDKMPDIWNGQNILRYELRFTSRLTKEFNRPAILAKTLPDEQFYIEVYNKWETEYQNIHKIHSFNFDVEKMKSPKDFWKQIALLAVNDLIGQEQVMEIVEELKAKKAFAKPEYYSRLKRELKELSKSPGLTKSSDMIEELSKKITDSKRLYR